MVVVDTSVWIDYFSDNQTAHTELLDSLLSTTIIIVGDLILAEILQGFKNDRDFKIAKSLLEELEPVQMTNVDLAIKSANNYRFLRKQGLTIRKTMDCLIATYCIERKLPLLYADRDFNPFTQHLKLRPALTL
jgi:predicted nucleic acid-binding protein